ncbi:hypothetical protein CON01_00810 [Bacillus thuringiensis]|uniref:Uncharacterized protein n=1 Tax=Bacillus thuringiensis TaxID=1428 RepID=A0A9X6YIY9_BACTU|nr:hypothetical protein [Bacillus thuringiensis]MEC0031125.1 hypothetical protein [Bacillus cereus]PED16422.1 hypothetical protein CON01_00810 [Bacillus thuringiensis]PES54386.1 hypothetical protein CN506_20130 [Bacillus thuringiensis]PGO85184.1 hypothetical protein CN990_21100 [Bacillus thuringiensis]
MKLVIYVNENFEEEKALFDLEKKEVLLQGDYYHDKIDAKIEGYLLALDIDSDDIAHEEVDSSHEHFKLLDFYE